MKINGSLVFDASSASKIQNLRIETVGTLPTWGSADLGRLVYLTTDNTIYFGDNDSWMPIATGGNAFSQTEGDSLEASIGPFVNADGTFDSSPGALTFSYITSPTSVTDAIYQLDQALNANNTLAELDDVTLTAAASGDFLRYNGTAWVDSTISLSTDLGITATAAELNTLDGITATTAELNILDGATLDVNELNILDGATLTTTELNYVDGVTSGIQGQLDNKQPLDATLTALAGMTGTGILVETGVDTFAHRSLTAPVAGITITNPDGVSGSPTFALANDLAALEGLTTTGYVVRTGDGTATTREITGASGRIAVTNGDGVASNTDIDLATLADSGAGTFLKITRDTYGRVSGTTAVVVGDITTLVDTVYVNTSGDTMTGNLNMGTNFVTQDNAPTTATQLANKAYVDAVAAGLSWKQAVRAATTANVALATDLENGDTLDGVTLATGDRVLVKDQTAAAENGIYIVQASGAAVRATDMDVAGDFAGATVFVTEGTANADSGWTQTSEVVTVGTTSVTWFQFSGASTYTWGTGLGNSGNTVFVKLGAGIAELPTDEVGIDVVSNLALQLTSSLAGGQLTFVLDAGSGLEQSSSGLKISADGVTNAMLLNDFVTVNGDAGTFNSALGTTIIVAGTSTQGINTSAAAGTLTITAADASASQKGVATFAAADFDVTAGNVTIKAAGVDNAQLANSSVTITGTTGSDAVALGESLAIIGDGAAISTAMGANSLAVSARLATDTLTGVASFDAAHFTVTAGAVALTASLDDLTNVSSADGAATGDLLTKTAGDWQNVTRADVVGSTSVADHNDVTVSGAADGQTLVYISGQWVNRKVFHTEAKASATTWTVTHNLGQKFCNVTIADDTDNVVIPQSIVFNSVNQLTVTFNTAIAGQVMVSGVAAV